MQIAEIHEENMNEKCIKEETTEKTLASEFN